MSSLYTTPNQVFLEIATSIRFPGGISDFSAVTDGSSKTGWNFCCNPSDTSPPSLSIISSPPSGSGM